MFNFLFSAINIEWGRDEYIEIFIYSIKCHSTIKREELRYFSIAIHSLARNLFDVIEIFLHLISFSISLNKSAIMLLNWILQRSRTRYNKILVRKKFIEIVPLLCVEGDEEEENLPHSIQEKFLEIEIFPSIQPLWCCFVEIMMWMKRFALRKLQSTFFIFQS